MLGEYIQFLRKPMQCPRCSQSVPRTDLRDIPQAAKNKQPTAPVPREPIVLDDADEPAPPQPANDGPIDLLSDDEASESGDIEEVASGPKAAHNDGIIDLEDEGKSSSGVAADPLVLSQPEEEVGDASGAATGSTRSRLTAAVRAPVQECPSCHTRIFASSGLPVRASDDDDGDDDGDGDDESKGGGTTECPLRFVHSVAMTLRDKWWQITGDAKQEGRGVGSPSKKQRKTSRSPSRRSPAASRGRGRGRGRGMRGGAIDRGGMNGVGYAGSSQDTQTQASALEKASLWQKERDEQHQKPLRALQQALPVLTVGGEGHWELSPEEDEAACHPLLLALLQAPSELWSPSLWAPVPSSRQKRSRPRDESDASSSAAASMVFNTLAPLLRTSMMDMTDRQRLFFVVRNLLDRIANCPGTAPFLLYKPPDEDNTPPAVASTDPLSLVPGRYLSCLTTFAALQQDRTTLRPWRSATGTLYSLLDRLREQPKTFFATMSAATSATLGTVEVQDGSERDAWAPLSMLCHRYISLFQEATKGLESFVQLSVGGEPWTRKLWDTAERESPSPASASASSAFGSASMPSAASAQGAAKASAGAGGGFSASSSAASSASGRGPLSNPSIPHAATEEERSRYELILRSEKFKSVGSLGRVHSFRNQRHNVSGAQMRRVVRVSRELATAQSMEVNWDSSIFIRTDAARVDLFRILITGPSETPYSNGMLLFDLVLPDSYPDVSPKAIYLSTHGGRIRFNPNLYADGKVCLSLLGTWAGAGWQPGRSTVVQVLLALQAQVLVPEPLFNEPGLDALQGRPQGQHRSATYNQSLRLATLETLIRDPLRAPDPAFRTVIRVHFFLKRAEIRAQCQAWAEEARRRHQEAEKANKSKKGPKTGLGGWVQSAGFQVGVPEQTAQVLSRMQSATNDIERELQKLERDADMPRLLKQLEAGE